MKKLRIIQSFFIVNVILLLPCAFCTIVDILNTILFAPMFKHILWIWNRLFLGFTLPIIFMRIFYLPYIISGILTVIYFYILQKMNFPKKEVIIFGFLLLICILGLISVEKVFDAAMGI